MPNAVLTVNAKESNVLISSNIKNSNIKETDNSRVSCREDKNILNKQSLVKSGANVNPVRIEDINFNSEKSTTTNKINPEDKKAKPVEKTYENIM
jgi:archaellum component FlaC